MEAPLPAETSDLQGQALGSTADFQVLTLKC